jgi:hypothetical protein
MSNANKQIDNFFDKVEKKVEDKQKEIVAEAMFSLFNKSPHISGPVLEFEHEAAFNSDDGAEWALGEYDSNHKISINNSPLTPHYPASMSRSISYARHIAESSQINSIKIGDHVRIENTTRYAFDVEEGGITWYRPGYYVYTNTLHNLKDKYRDVVK